MCQQIAPLVVFLSTFYTIYTYMYFLHVVPRASRNFARTCALRSLFAALSFFLAVVKALPLDVRRRVLRAIVTEAKHRLEFVKSCDVRYTRYRLYILLTVLPLLMAAKRWHRARTSDALLALAQSKYPW